MQGTVTANASNSVAERKQVLRTGRFVFTCIYVHTEKLKTELFLHCKFYYIANKADVFNA